MIDPVMGSFFLDFEHVGGGIKIAHLDRKVAIKIINLR